MATYTTNRTKHATLQDKQVDTVHIVEVFGTVRVTSRGDADIYVRTDFTDPVVLGDDCFVITKGSEKVLPVADITNIEVRLISNKNVPYSVEVV